jgi:hypothetical protein
VSLRPRFPRPLNLGAFEPVDNVYTAVEYGLHMLKRALAVLLATLWVGLCGVSGLESLNPAGWAKHHSSTHAPLLLPATNDTDVDEPVPYLEAHQSASLAEVHIPSCVSQPFVHEKLQLYKLNRVFLI